MKRRSASSSRIAPDRDDLGAALLQEARGHERECRIAEAIACYELAIAAAERRGKYAVLPDALRHLAILRFQRDQPGPARELCQRSYELAQQRGNDVLAAKALNTLGALDLKSGAMEEARGTFLNALELGDSSQELVARVEQNLGILANIQGDLDEALKRYKRSLEAYRGCTDVHGCAIAYHNLGMVSADRELWDEAEQYFRESLAIAESSGDVYLQALCLVNQAEVEVARQRYENARQGAERALALYDRVDARGAKADAYRVLGTVYRETARPALAEARLREAIALAASAGSALNEAEASRELALLYQNMGRNAEALRLLKVAHDLFRRLDARVDLVHVGGKVAQLEGTYLAVVRAWGESIESSDSYTFGHCERVARNAVAMARALGFDDQLETTILLGAYLHDVGLLRVPHEILRKPGPLTPDELAIVRLHPIWGVELLADVDFPWDLKPIIRWHHECYDGTGYPDRLAGDAIPLSAQVVGLLETYDALTTRRAYQSALSHEQAVAQIHACGARWSPRVVEAFLETVAGRIEA